MFDSLQSFYSAIIYLHVPFAWLSLAIYAGLGLAGAGYLVWRNPRDALIAEAAAPIGATLCALCLITGMLWGKPTWGAYWVWDARLTSMLVLFLLYLGYVTLARTIADEAKRYQAVSILALIGCLNLPIIKFSVEWWNTLHQPASIMRRDGVAIHETILIPMLVSFLLFAILAACLTYLSYRTKLAEKKILRAQRKKRHVR